MPSKEKVNVRTTGEDTGDIFAGTFEFYMSLPAGRLLELDQYRRAYIGSQGNVMLSTTVDLAEQLASIRAHTCNDAKDEPIAPSWWKESQFGLELTDLNVIKDIYKSLLLAKEAYANELKTKRESARQKLEKMPENQ